MANVPITGLPAAQPITGTELVPVVQNGITVRTTTAAISSAPNQTQTFVTVNQEPTLPNSRSLSGANGVGITDNGAQSTLRVSLNGTSGSLETSGAGIIAKTSGNVVAPRTLTASGLGLSVTNGDGNSGNPTFQLTGIAAAIAQASGTGLLAIVGGTAIAGRQLYGTANQIAIANGDGSGNPTISITDNPVLPGTGAVTVPSGTAAQQPVGYDGQIRFNTTTSLYEGYTGGAWRPFAVSTNPGVFSFSAGTTGFSPSVNTTGVVTLSGTLNVANGGTGVTTSTGTGSVVLSTSPTLVTPALGTPSALVGTNITGTAAGLTAGSVTTNANLTGAVTSIGNATSLGSFTSANLASALTDETGTGVNVFATSPTLVTPILGTPQSVTLTNATGLPISTGVSGLGTGVAAALAVNVGTAGSPIVNGGALGTPASGTLTNTTGLPLTTGVTGTLPVSNGGTGAATLTANNVLLGNGTSALQVVAPGTSGNILTSNGTTWASSVPAPGGITYSKYTSNVTAVDKQGVIADTTAGSFTVTLPATPTTGNQVVVVDGGNWATNNLIIGRNGSTIENIAQDMTVDIGGVAITFIYNGTTWDIYSQLGVVPTTAGSFTSILDSGNLTFTGTGNRITGDFSNATPANRTVFQTSTVNSFTTIDAIPSGTGTLSQWTAFAQSDPNNSSLVFMRATASTDVRFSSGITGTGTYLPMTFYTGGSERVRVDTSGNVGIGTTAVVSPARLDVTKNTTAGDVTTQRQLRIAIDSSAPYSMFLGYGQPVVGQALRGTIQVLDNSIGSDLLLNPSGGNVGIGTSSPGVKLDVSGLIRSSGYSISGTGVTGGTTVFSAGTISTDANWGMYFRAPTGSSAFAEYSFRNAADTERLRITTTGDVTVSSAALLGYGAGSGGTVTQTTSKATSVTLNKPTGQITMNNAALAAGTTVAFQCANNLVGQRDLVIANIAWGTIDPTNYSIRASAYITAAGTILFQLKNESAVSLSEAVIINFAVIKGAIT